MDCDTRDEGYTWQRGFLYAAVLGFFKKSTADGQFKIMSSRWRTCSIFLYPIRTARTCAGTYHAWIPPTCFQTPQPANKPRVKLHRWRRDNLPSMLTVVRYALERCLSTCDLQCESTLLKDGESRYNDVMEDRTWLQCRLLPAVVVGSRPFVSGTVSLTTQRALVPV